MLFEPNQQNPFHINMNDCRELFTAFVSTHKHGIRYISFIHTHGNNLHNDFNLKWCVASSLSQNVFACVYLCSLLNSPITYAILHMFTRARKPVQLNENIRMRKKHEQLKSTWFDPRHERIWRSSIHSVIARNRNAKQSHYNVSPTSSKTPVSTLVAAASSLRPLQLPHNCDCSSLSPLPLPLPLRWPTAQTRWPPNVVRSPECPLSFVGVRLNSTALPWSAAVWQYIIHGVARSHSGRWICVVKGTLNKRVAVQRTFMRNNRCRRCSCACPWLCDASRRSMLLCFRCFFCWWDVMFSANKKRGSDCRPKPHTNSMRMPCGFGPSVSMWCNWKLSMQLFTWDTENDTIDCFGK